MLERESPSVPLGLWSPEELLADKNKRVDLLYHIIFNASEGTRSGLLADMMTLHEDSEKMSVAERLKKEKGSELLATILSNCSPAMQQGLQRDMLTLAEEVKDGEPDNVDVDNEF